MSGTHSTDALVKELIDFCRSESVSEDGLREIFQRFGCAPNNIDNHEFFLWACHNGSVTEGILRCLLEYFPDAAGYTSVAGVTPLHNICYNKNATRGMVQLLIDAHPESIDKATNNAGNTPLHYLCYNKNLEDTNAVDVLGLILERCPEAARRAETNGALPIHNACGVGLKSPEFCRMLIDAYPGSERVVVEGQLPLHIACRHGSVAAAKYLYKLYPESIYVTNPYEGGGCPIHYAIHGLTLRANPATAIEMVQLLLDCDPSLASQKLSGKFPLVIIFTFARNNRNNPSKSNAALKILQLLYDAHPEAIEDRNLSSLITMIPEKIQTFVNAQLNYARTAMDRAFMSTRDEYGQLPLHRALRDKAPLGSIKLLVKRNPSALLTPDNSGALPLHTAIQHHNRKSTKVVDYLIGLDSNTLTAVDREGNTALHVACRGIKCDAIVLLLEKYGALSVSQSNVRNKLPIHLLLESNANTVVSRDDYKYLNSLFQLLRAYPEAVMVSEDAKLASIPQVGRPSRSGKKRKYCA